MEEKRIQELYEGGASYEEIGTAIGKSAEAIRSHIRRRNFYKDVEPIGSGTVTRHKINNDGTQTSTKVVSLNKHDLKDPEKVLLAHDYNPDKWQIVSSSNSYWDQNSKDDGMVTLTSSRITVKPLHDPWYDIIDQIKLNTTPLIVEPEYEEESDRYLVIGANDLHFGSNTYEDYMDSQQEIINLLLYNYKKCIIYLGGDLLDTDNLRGTTAHGTFINKISMADAWADLVAYVEPIIISSCKNSVDTEVLFVRGNHSESMEWAFMQYLKVRFPDVKIDDNLSYLKARLLGKNFIGFTHGQYNANNTPLNLARGYPELWGKAKHFEVLAAHKHRESIDKNLIIRTLPTRAKETEYVEEMNFNTAHKSFMCIEYGDVGAKQIHYV